MKGREVVGNVLMDIIEDDGSRSLNISVVLPTSLRVFKVSVLRKVS